mmetsp:Transcript_25886/g.64676  ORF Transcript_25886/g.64676 Transcript_25886/m.64676 type:complete len:260 (-) Transcript_25886:792-1571(-)
MLRDTDRLVAANNVGIARLMAENRDDSDSDLDFAPFNSKAEPPRKKAKPYTTPEKVLTFKLSHSPVQVQVRASHTIYQLVDIVCQTTHVGMDESFDDHLWDVTIPRSGRKYRSLEENGRAGKALTTHFRSLNIDAGARLYLLYDYGDNREYEFLLVDLRELDDVQLDEESSRNGAFPRAVPLNVPGGYQLFATNDANLDIWFPELSEFFRKAHEKNLFQFGRKQMHRYLASEDSGFKHMIFLPIKCVDFIEFFQTFNFA